MTPGVRLEQEGSGPFDKRLVRVYEYEGTSVRSERCIWSGTYRELADILAAKSGSAGTAPIEYWLRDYVQFRPHFEQAIVEYLERQRESAPSEECHNVAEIEVRRGFGSIELATLAADEFVTASGKRDGGYIVWKRLPPAPEKAR